MKITPPIEALSLSLREKMLMRILRQAVSGTLNLRLANGQGLRFDTEKPGIEAYITLANDTMPHKVVDRGTIGFAESYMDGDWSTGDLTKVIYFMLTNVDAIEHSIRGHWWMRLLQFLQFKLHRNSRSGAKRNIHAHYDLGNNFYRAWLDESMTYSSGLYLHEDDNLERSQFNKYRRILDKIKPEAGHSVLEIGCGWGGFAELLITQTPAHYTGVTISEEQYRFARERLANLRYHDGQKAHVLAEDYRDIKGRFDHIVSIEMFEAVGQEYWDTYFAQIKALLKPGGKAVIQTISIIDRLFESYANESDFIRHYIFPGGMLPSIERLEKILTRQHLKITDNFTFGQDYARTLRAWSERFEAAWPMIKSNHFDDRFRRMWQYYLSCCEAAFLAERINVHHLTIEHV